MEVPGILLRCLLGLVFFVTLEVVGLYVRILADVTCVGNFNRCSELFVVVATHSSCAKYQVVVVEGGDDGLEDADANAAALRVDTIIDVDGQESRMLEDLQTVVFQEGVEDLRIGQRSVGN